MSSESLAIEDFVGKCAGAIIDTIFMHEYLSTLTSEIDLFWGTSYSGASALFFANRYLGLLNNNHLVWFLGVIGIHDHSFCVVWSWLAPLIQLPQFLVWAAISALRTYAVNRGRMTFPLIVFVLLCIPLSANVAKAVRMTASLSKGLCAPAINHPPSPHPQATLVVARISWIVADTILVGCTWVATYGTVRRSLRDGAVHSAPTLMHICNRDGSIYFVCMTLLSLVHLGLSVDETRFERRVAANMVSSVIDPLISMLISRLMLNLRASNKRLTEPSFGDLIDLHMDVAGTTLQFATISSTSDLELSPTSMSHVSSSTTHVRV
ncbi:hypothetical protein C8Q76DRAFT_760534 [Earliella scabrosa]|nr:hypothetical protein C8Q76DRAFT_760534 [Earliella scabrosa]